MPCWWSSCSSSRSIDALAGALLLAASLAAPDDVAARSPLPQPAAAISPLTLLDVPYLSQSEALCGGAAAAMVMRYWGAVGIDAEAFAPLVDRSAGGIRTTALTQAVQARGFDAAGGPGSEAQARAELAQGRPVIALVEDRPGVYHYVVVVGWHDRAVVLHDPARTPYVLERPEAFLERWQASDRWMLVMAPRAKLDPPPVAVEPASGAGGGGCEAVVAEGVRQAQQRDLAAAERTLTGAAYRCPGAAPLRELAGVRLLQRRWPEVRDLASRATSLDPADGQAWRLLGAARYVEGDRDGALDAWNRVGEPAIDLVSINGLQRTTHRTVERLLGLTSGEVLQGRALDRAARRLADLPAAALTMVEYVPRPGGRVEVRANVVERRVLPAGRLTWAAIGLRAAAAREISLPVSSLGRGGERLDVSWRFWPNRQAAGLALHVPSPAGVISIDAFSERQPFNDAALPPANRLTAGASVGQWVAGALYLEVHGGIARWNGDRTLATAGGGGRWERDRFRIGADLTAWMGDASFATGSLHAGWRSAAERRGFVAEFEGGAELATARTPLDLWPAGDTGHARRPLLRAHPVLDGDGRLRVDRLGRSVAYATAEAQHWWRPNGIPVAAALFLDTALTARRASAPSRLDADTGAGLRLTLPGRRGLLRLDYAHGLRDGRNAISLSWNSNY